MRMGADGTEKQENAENGCAAHLKNEGKKGRLRDRELAVSFAQ